MKQYLMEFLAELEKLIPPPQQCHHAIMLNTRPGEPPYLAIHVNIGGKFHSCFFDDTDFNYPPAIVALMVKERVTTYSPQWSPGKSP